MKLIRAEFQYLALCLEGFLFGLYSGIFAMYLQYVGSQKSTDKAKNTILYALWVLYALSAAIVIISILGCSGAVTNIEIIYYLGIIEIIVFACCDFMAQFILIYRCWIMWGYNVCVVIVPSFLAFAFLAFWIASGAIIKNFYASNWRTAILELAGLGISMTVNALVTGLIVFRIFKVFQEVKTCTADEQILGVTGGSRLQRVIFILIESGMALFSVQAARLVVSSVTIVMADAGGSANAVVFAAYDFISGIHVMLNGITPTIILVRVSMGLSFHDESSMVETTSTGSFFRFQIPEILNPVPENAIVDEGRHDDFEIQLGYTDGRQMS